MSAAASAGEGRSGYSEADAVGAIRLVMEAGADDRTRSAVIGEVLRRAPLTDPSNVSSVNLLLQAVRAAKAEFNVTDHAPPPPQERS